MTDFAIHKNGFWESIDSSGHVYDEPLCDAIVKVLKNEKAANIIDLGCGMGNYVKALREQGFECDGFDGNPNTVILTNGMAKVLDFSIPFNLHKKYDWVLSLEVGEHIPQEFEKIFLDNVVNHAKKGIILSWAIPGQKGDGHVNCKSNRYIIQQMKKRGWRYDLPTARDLRKEAALGWFKNTIMIFRNTGKTKSIFQIIPSFFHK